jgi:hypothetical protein
MKTITEKKLARRLSLSVAQLRDLRPPGYTRIEVVDHGGGHLEGVRHYDRAAAREWMQGLDRNALRATVARSATLSSKPPAAPARTQTMHRKPSTLAELTAQVSRNARLLARLEQTSPQRSARDAAVSAQRERERERVALAIMMGVAELDDTPHLEGEATLVLGGTYRAPQTTRRSPARAMPAPERRTASTSTPRPPAQSPEASAALRRQMGLEDDGPNVIATATSLILGP